MRTRGMGTALAVLALVMGACSSPGATTKPVDGCS